jgi:hypothetical protein
MLVAVVMIENAEGGLMQFASENRYVEIDGGELFPLSRLSADGFEDFDADIGDSGFFDDPENPGWHSSAYASASQESVLSSVSVVARGESYASAEMMDMGGGGVEAFPYAESRMEVIFTVPKQGFYTLHGMLSGISVEPAMPMMPMGNAVAGVKFLRSDGTYLLDLEESFMEGSIGFYASGVLPQDTYTLIYHCWTDFSDPGMMGTTQASYNIALEVTPEPATMSLLALSGLAMVRRRRK